MYRLTNATYSDGRSFGYQYDAVGNVLQYTQTQSGSTIATTYNYNNGNQLTTAQMDNSPILWQYVYDPVGRLTEVLPDGNPANGAKKYIYNTAGYLIQAEAHDGGGYQLQAEMLYDGLGQRLSMTGYALGTSVTTNYVLDPMQYARPLTATSNGNTTVYLYGIDPIAELTTSWSYSLPDGTNTPRQLTDELGAITLVGRYTPWGDSLEYTGAGNFTFGYFGGLMDVTTGLLYVGNGQYYDPATGRFLTRDAQPGKINPYVPWGGDPSGAILAPLALLGLIYGRKKKKSKFDYVVIVLFVAVGMGMGLSACAPANQPSTLPGSSQSPAVPPASASTPVPPTSNPNVNSTPPVQSSSTATSLVEQIFATPCPTPNFTLTPISSYESPLLSIYGVELLNGTTDTNGIWNQRLASNVWRAVVDVANKLGGPLRFREVFHTNGQNLVMKKVGSYIEYLTGNVQVEHKHGAITRGTHLIEFADIDYYADDSIRNNVVHELGHVYNNNQGDPANTMPYNFVTDRNKFLRQVGDDHISWQLHPPAEGESSNLSETFADMFVAHIYNAWVMPENISPNPQLWIEGIVK